MHRHDLIFTAPASAAPAFTAPTSTNPTSTTPTWKTPTSTTGALAWFARHKPETTAIIQHGSPITYGNLAAAVVRCVWALKAGGVVPGMLVGLQMPLRYPHLAMLLACEATGATEISLPANVLSNGEEIIKYCDVVLAADVPASASLPKKIGNPRDWLARVATAPVREQDLTELEHQIAPGQIARVVRGSGTTGRPKGMPMSHATQQLRMIRMIDIVAPHILPRPRYLCMYPFGLAGAYIRAIGMLQNGGTILLAEQHELDDLLTAGAANYAHFTLGDTERVIGRGVRSPSGHKMHVEVFGGAVPAPLRQKISEQLNARVTNKYASNESNAISIVDDDNVGTLCRGVEVRIVDENGQDKPDGEAGLVRVRTETMIHGYFNDPALTAAAFIDGWFHTADIGTRLAPDKLIVTGRADDVLNIGGLKFASSPIEARIKQIDGLNDAIVMNYARVDASATLVAAVETDNVPLPPDVEQKIVSILRRYTGGFEIMPLRKFPRTESGKIMRPAIEAAFRQHQAP